MIKIFLKGLPYTLTQPMFREFEAKQKELQRWIVHSKSTQVKKYLKQNEIIEYLFALGIYYRYVIAPLTRTGEFFERIESRDVSGLLIGGREIGPDFRHSISNAESHFNNVLHKYGISEHFFSLTDVKQLVISLIRIDERRQDGQE